MQWLGLLYKYMTSLPYIYNCFWQKMAQLQHCTFSLIFQILIVYSPGGMVVISHILYNILDYSSKFSFQYKGVTAFLQDNTFVNVNTTDPLRPTIGDIIESRYPYCVES